LLAVLCISLFVISVSARTKWHQLQTYSFNDYTREFHKIYADQTETSSRAKLFYNNLVKIQQHNADPTQTWKMGVNQFTDRTPAEFNMRLGYKHLFESNSPTLKSIRDQYMIPYSHSGSYNLDTLPQTVDWRSTGIITAVKDQGQCGSCWTFGSTETIESYWANQTKGQLADLSEQQILDCTPNPDDCGGTGGCGGGTPELAYAQIIKSGGLASEWTYPYTSYFGSAFSCQSKSKVAMLKGYTKLPSNEYEPIVNHLATVGPLAINVDASSWSAYESGVFNGCNQVNPDIDHVVQLVGYGTDTKLNMDYWLVRNSWSPSWGEDGYVRLYRTSSKRCGWDTRPQDGTGCNGGPTEVNVCGTCGLWYDTSYPVVSVSA